MRAVAEREDHPRRQQRQQRGHQQGRLPAPAGIERAHPVRQRGAQGQHADQPGERRARVLRHPAHHQLHAQRIDAGERQADGETPGQAIRQSLCEQREAGIGRCAEEGAHGEDAARREAVGETAEREAERAEDEAELHRDRQPPDVGRIERPRAHQVVARAVGGEPQRGAEELGDDDDGKREGAHGGRVCGAARRRSSREIPCRPGRSWARPPKRLRLRLSRALPDRLDRPCALRPPIIDRLRPHPS